MHAARLPLGPGCVSAAAGTCWSAGSAQQNLLFSCRVGVSCVCARSLGAWSSSLLLLPTHAVTARRGGLHPGDQCPAAAGQCHAARPCAEGAQQCSSTQHGLLGHGRPQGWAPGPRVSASLWSVIRHCASPQTLCECTSEIQSFACSIRIQHYKIQAELSSIS